MDATITISIIKEDRANSIFVDRVADFYVSDDYALTWRRRGQEDVRPHEFNDGKVLSWATTASAFLADYLAFESELREHIHPFYRESIGHAFDYLYQSIEAAVASGPAWEYHHSEWYYAYIDAVDNGVDLSPFWYGVPTR